MLGSLLALNIEVFAAANFLQKTLLFLSSHLWQSHVTVEPQPAPKSFFITQI